MDPISALIGGGLSLFGGIFGSSSARAQNREEREWQERMSNTQYQRAVGDMKAAGLNPAMMYARGGGGSPVAGGARMEEGRGLSEGIKGAGMAAAQMALTKAQIADVSSAAALKLAQTEAVKQSKMIEKADWDGKNPSRVVDGEIVVDNGQWGALQRRQMETQIAESIARQKGIDASAAEALARKGLIEVQRRVQVLGIPEAQAWADYWKQMGVYGVGLEVGGKLFNNFKSLIPGVGKLFRDGGANSAPSLRRRTTYYYGDQ